MRGGGTNSCGLDDFGGGTLASGFTGTLDKTLGGLTLLASGYLERLGALNQTFPTLSVQATGTLSAYHVPTLINVRDITATGAGAIGVDVVNNAISQNVRANSLQVENGGSLEAHGVYYDTITTIGTGAIVPIRSDRAVWDVTNYADRHASDIYGSTWAYHRNPALSGAYTVDHPSVRRILDVTSVSLNEMAALLGTLLDDLGLT